MFVWRWFCNIWAMARAVPSIPFRYHGKVIGDEWVNGRSFQLICAAVIYTPKCTRFQMVLHNAVATLHIKLVEFRLRNVRLALICLAIVSRFAKCSLLWIMRIRNLCRNTIRILHLRTPVCIQFLNMLSESQVICWNLKAIISCIWVLLMLILLRALKSSFVNILFLPFRMGHQLLKII